jgi:ABC-type antimicrobial peptide transport system permease subunit
MVMMQTFVLTAIGITMGLGLTFWSNRLLHEFLYGVSQTDPWTMLLVPVGLLTRGIAATIAPARHASSIDPVQSLRTE